MELAIMNVMMMMIKLQLRFDCDKKTELGTFRYSFVNKKGGKKDNTMLI